MHDPFTIPSQPTSDSRPSPATVASVIANAHATFPRGPEAVDHLPADHPAPVTTAPVVTGGSVALAERTHIPGRTALPDGNEVGVATLWTLRTGRSNSMTIEAKFLGVGSSHQYEHRNHVAEHAVPKEHCRACRWFETRIFRIDNITSEAGAPSRVTYLLHHVGVSTVPGEQNYYRHEFAHSGPEVIEAFTIRKNARDGGPQEPFLTRPAARALSQAAGFDPSLKSAWQERTVA